MPIASRIAATQAANFSDNHNASTSVLLRTSHAVFPRRQHLCVISLRFLQELENHISPMWVALLRFLQIPERLAPHLCAWRLSESSLPSQGLDASPPVFPNACHHAWTR